MNEEAIPIAENVLGFIEANPEQHDQEVWRCQTGMCFAGWFGQLSGAQWVIDYTNPAHMELVKKIGCILDDYVYAEGKGSRTLRSWTTIWGNETVESVVRAGIDLDAHIMAVSEYVRAAMGIDVVSAHVLFSEHNSLEDLKLGVKGLANGQFLTEEFNDDDERVIVAKDPL